MKKPLLIQLSIILGLSLSSCQLLPFGTETESVSDGANSTSSPEEELASEPVDIEEENQAVETKIEETVPPARTVAGLKKATDPEEFIQGRGITPGENRSDPFNLFPIAPDGEVRRQPAASNSPSPTEPLPSLPTDQPAPPPEPKLARAVQVQGAVKIGNQVTAILRAPNEQTSRYVRPGQWIANNQVLVKRINIDQRPTPTVVLEELGIEQEVVKSVEEGMAVDATTVEQKSVGQLPPLPPPPPSSI